MIGCKFVPGDVLWQRRYILLKAMQDAVVILQPIKKKNKKKKTNNRHLYRQHHWKWTNESLLCFVWPHNAPCNHRLPLGQTTLIGNTPENNRLYRQPWSRLRRSVQEVDGLLCRLKRCFSVPVSTNPFVVRTTVTLEGAIDSAQVRKGKSLWSHQKWEKSRKSSSSLDRFVFRYKSWNVHLWVRSMGGKVLVKGVTRLSEG